MQLHDYQPKALATAQPEAFALEYLVPGIVGEVGELAGHLAKGHWHGTPADHIKVNLVKEYGDVCWMTAVLLHTYGVADVKVPDYYAAEDKPLAALIDRASQLFTEYAWGEQELRYEAQRMWKTLVRNVEPITGTDMATVLQVNLTKLASRAERGVLRGAGDDR